MVAVIQEKGGTGKSTMHTGEMLKVILMALLAAMSSSALAEWKFFGNSAENDARVYTDSSGIHNDADTVKLRELMDYKTRHVHDQIKPFSSTVSLQEYDCKKMQARFTYLSHYSENMGKGASVFTAKNPDSEWFPVPPGTMEEAIGKWACKAAGATAPITGIR